MAPSSSQGCASPGRARNCARSSVIEIGWWAHGRRGFFELFVATNSPTAKEALERIGKLYDIVSAVIRVGSGRQSFIH